MTILRLREEALGGRQGASAAATSLAQLACLTALRATESDESAATWPTPALADHVLGAALRQVHEPPGRRWTVMQLAAAAHLAPASFTARFRLLTGQPPSLYLARLRMREVAYRIRTTDDPLSLVAAEAGYASQAAFSRAFKRVTGRSPSSLRRGLRETKWSS